MSQSMKDITNRRGVVACVLLTAVLLAFLGLLVTLLLRVIGVFPLLIGLVLAIAGAFALAWWNHRRTKEAHWKSTNQDVEAALQEVLTSTKWYDQWEMFLVWPIEDAHLESIRQRCIAVDEEEGGKSSNNGWLSEEGLKKVEALLRELRKRE
jgi:hypothetical protein